MGQPEILTLLSDFGDGQSPAGSDRDVYVGVMKGVIAQINSRLRIIDLNHQIPP